MITLKLVLYIASLFMILVVCAPFVKKDIWFIRILDYPRLQKFIIIVGLSLAWISQISVIAQWYDYAIPVILLICALYLGYLIYPFSPLGTKMIGNSKSADQKAKLDILVANVFQENRNYPRLLRLITARNPDIVFLLEIDTLWLEGIKSLRNHFPYYIEVPKENTYGLVFYSKLPIKTSNVNYLIDPEVPSIAVDVLSGDHGIKIFGLHPTPPVPQENSHSTERDAEILMIGKMAKKETGPCVVIGDLNDVAWSYTTELFLKVSELLDPRRGRGLYSTFHAKYLLFRWPLDHFFVSRHFSLVHMKVEKHIGSDHFPISIALQIDYQNEERPLTADAADKELAEKKIQAGKEFQDADTMVHLHAMREVLNHSKLWKFICLKLMPNKLNDMYQISRSTIPLPARIMRRRLNVVEAQGNFTLPNQTTEN